MSAKDGNTFTGRFVPFLHSGSLIFKGTIFSEFSEYWIKPYKHYIPISLDFLDVVAKLKWAYAYPKQAYEIVKQSERFAREHLTREQMNCYTYLLGLELARLGDVE